MGTPRSFGRSFSEGATIVFSILLAFGIDAWWDGHQARRDAVDALGRVVQEVSRARERVGRGALYKSRYSSLTMQLMDVVRETPDSAPVTVPDTLLVGLLMSQVTEIPTYNVSRFVASESFELIPDSILRDAIGDWLPMVEDQIDDQAEVRRLKEEQIKPILRRSGDVARAQRVAIGTAGQVGGEISFGATTFVAAPELRALLEQLVGYDRQERLQVLRIESLALDIETRSRAVLGRR